MDCNVLTACAKLALSEGQKITAARRGLTKRHQQCCKQSSENNLTFFLLILIKNTRLITTEAEHLWSFMQTRQQQKKSFPIYLHITCASDCKDLCNHSVLFLFYKITKKVMPAEKLEILFFYYYIEKAATKH